MDSVVIVCAIPSCLTPRSAYAFQPRRSKRPAGARGVRGGVRYRLTRAWRLQDGAIADRCNGASIGGLN